MIILEWILEFIISTCCSIAGDTLFKPFVAPLEKKIGRKARTHNLSAKQLIEIGDLSQNDIKDNRIDGFDFTDCTYVDLKRLWYNLRKIYP